MNDEDFGRLEACPPSVQFRLSVGCFARQPQLFRQQGKRLFLLTYQIFSTCHLLAKVKALQLPLLCNTSVQLPLFLFLRHDLSGELNSYALRTQLLKTRNKLYKQSQF